MVLELKALVVELCLCLERRGLNDSRRDGVLEAGLAVGARGRALERLGVGLRAPVRQRVGATNEGDERQAAVRVQLLDELLPAGAVTLAVRIMDASAVAWRERSLGPCQPRSRKNSLRASEQPGRRIMLPSAGLSDLHSERGSGVSCAMYMSTESACTL